ncbi:MAG TPA: Spy/CpxP family protein refolding chaperone [Pyrinomonadaceae bacterium]|nr:Spy/CpxP family protein refolding chaperone [Pyrinomonadaceae bacterium]
MYGNTFPKLFLLLTFLLAMATAGLAQGPPSQGPPRDAGIVRPPQGPGPEQRPNLFRELGLSPEQIQAIRQLNRESQPQNQAARKRFDDANRELNKVIYSDRVDETAYKARLAEYQAAQAEIAELKFANEFAVRKILTPEQLVLFRELRQRFAERMENLRDRRQPLPGPSRPAGNPPQNRQPRNN